MENKRKIYVHIEKHGKTTELSAEGTVTQLVKILIEGMAASEVFYFAMSGAVQYYEEHKDEINGDIESFEKKEDLEERLKQ